ncbi:AAA family ATPase [Bacillus sp. HNG]|uniref:AAA family ATPase n=1 Tax=Bacillus sp. HNG TaxID=2293325 RepID=UPI000E2EB339|nr:AAA family ATPase [Bacillus sp. HNG]RFB18926.1 AAA family ATPase [Bacillus sp. HNG]
MNNRTNNSIYIISGPYGVGKSTVTKALAREMENVVRIEGDLIKSMYVGKTPLPREKQRSLLWKNILSITKNCIENNMNVMIDYVVRNELQWFCKHFSNLDVKIYYVVLRADGETLIKRLNKRGHGYLIQGSLYLLDHLEKGLPNKNHLYDTTNKLPIEIITDLQSRFEQFSL